MEKYLQHYGIQGQKWGVRRYQNLDGSYTTEGKLRRNHANVAKTKNDVDSIMRTMSKKDRDFLTLEKWDDLPDDVGYLRLDDSSSVAKRVLLRDKKEPVAVFDIFTSDATDYGMSSVAVRDGDHRGKGYGTKAVRKGIEWYEKHGPEAGIDYLQWWARDDNTASNNLALKTGFKYNETVTARGHKWNGYVYRKLEESKDVPIADIRKTNTYSTGKKLLNSL